MLILQEEIKAKAKARVMGNIKVIGELYKKSLLTEQVRWEEGNGTVHRSGCAVLRL